MSKQFGSTLKPLKLRCTSIGVPSPSEAYWCLVTEDGNQFYFSVGSFQQAMLISSQSAAVAAKLGEESAKA